MGKKYLLSVFFGCTAFLLFSQETVRINNVQLFDGERLLTGMSVWVEDGIVVRVTKNEPMKANINVDGQGKFLMPALTNCHVHAWSKQLLMEAAQAGVLNLLDMAGYEPIAAQLKTLHDSIPYASYYAAGAPATAPGGHGTQFGYPTPTLSRPEEARKFVDDRVEAGADYIKIIVEPWKNTLTPDTVKALIDAAHARNKLAVVHVSKLEDAKMAIQKGADGLVHLYTDALIDDASLQQLVKEHSFFIIPTLVLTAVKEEKAKKEGTALKNRKSLKELQNEIKRYYDAGVPILTGTDPPNSQINYGTDLYKEMQLLVEAGIPSIEVLKDATAKPMGIFGIKDKGSVQAGYQADLVLIDGNPLENMQDLHQIVRIWKLGHELIMKTGE